MKYISVCSGIEAASVAWYSLGFEPVGFSEIEPFPSAVLAHHYPNITNLGDMTKYKEWNIEHPDILVGGTPCQSFSVAGLRKGLDDPRGNLALTYCGILDHFRPQWFVWENVPGVLSSSGGRDFGSFLGALAELGYGFAYRVLDAQFFGVAQRRRRVFVVGYLGDWRPPAAVLFERESLRRDTAPRREKGEVATRSAAFSAGNSSGSRSIGYVEEGTPPLRAGASGTNQVPTAICFEPRSPDGHARLIGDFAPTLNRMGGGQREPCVMYAPETARCVTTGEAKRQDYETCAMVAQPMAFAQNQLGEVRTGDVFNTINTNSNASGRNTPMVAQPTYSIRTAHTSINGWGIQKEVTHTLDQAMGVAVSHPFGLDEEQNAVIDGFGCLKARESGGGLEGSVMQTNMAVRRLTPVECERLQGFPDNYTNIPWRKFPESPDGPRYKALGNSMAVPVMRWIGKRIKQTSETL